MTNNKQQTAVEWLEEQIEWYNKELLFDLMHEIQKAKEMEKEQKKECWDVAHQAGRFEGKGIAEKNWQTFEQYSNETYGNNHIGDVNKMVGGKQ
jgi:DNA uptake protein ComE-like DNA-binding protein